MNERINELYEAVKYFSSRSPYDNVPKWIFKLVCIYLAIMITFGLMDVDKRLQRNFQNSRDFRIIESD